MADSAPQTQAIFRLRAGERVALLFFVYLAGLGIYRQIGATQIVALLAMAVAIFTGALWESSRSTAVTRVVRDWLSMGLILAGYWSVGWFVRQPLVQRQEEWLGWDRVVLGEWGLRAAVESTGIVIPTVLEILYLLLYAVPPICICAIYWVGGRQRVHAFLYTLLIGTFSAYALLPLVPVHGPHVVYPLLDLPNQSGFGRALNVWILDHMDIPTSVFPSGHVAVAFASAFGMLRAVRRHVRLWAPVFAVATLVYVATIYCRYHYCVDGLASIAVATAAWFVSGHGEEIS
jgi:membrane-associated phospholipid phosphatase